MYKIIISDKAKRMLGQHIAFIAKVNKQVAKDTKNQIISSIKSLNNIPQRYPFLEADFIPHNKYHKLIINRRYIALFQIKDNTIYIDYILDIRKDYQWLK